MNGIAHDPRISSPLTPTVFSILLALVDGERHGYGILQEVSRCSAGSARMGPGMLYGSLQCMLAEGLVEEAGERADPRSGGERRRYYRLSTIGRRAVRVETLRQAQPVHIAENKYRLFGPETRGDLACR
jgi:DNA-binding PadR family transcriptional regulator